MIDGRHCTRKDLDLLINETNKVKLSINDINLNAYYKLIARFDQYTADELKRLISVTSSEDEIRRIIDQKVYALKQSILVDIYEHQ